MSVAEDGAERRAWLRLARTPRIGPVSFAGLIARYGQASEALAALPSLSRSPVRIPDEKSASDEIEASERAGAQLVYSCDPDYPARLSELGSPPPVLSVIGDVALFNRSDAIAIVGARQASAGGRKLARLFASELSKAGHVIVSGLARGVDGEAHAAALEGGTIAVLGGGVDHVYPEQHRALYGEIAERGLIVSESPFGHRATARDFPRRNRIITGLAAGVVVVEAAERSGSLISARTAGEQGREVMAVPGSPLDARAAGTNRLIREGATLVRDAGDVIEALGGLFPGTPRSWREPVFDAGGLGEAPEGAAARAGVLQALSSAPLPVDEIARAAGLDMPDCAALLMELELSGEARTLPGGLACRA